MARPLRRSLPVLVTLSLLAAGCGDDGSAEDDPVDDTPDYPTADATTTAPSDDTSDAAGDAEPEATTTTEPTAAPIEALDPAEIPDLVAAWGEGTDPALQLARDIVAFPLEIPPPSDGGAYAVRVELSADDPDAPWYWDWEYDTIAAEPIGDIDIDLDDNGPGAVALRTYGDEVMGELGWSYSNSTGSDPSSGGGGPQSINHVYVNDVGTIPLGTVDATTNPVFLWADEDLGFESDPPLEGYRFDVSLDIPAGTVPVPLLETVLDALPRPDDARITDASVRSYERSADSFDAAEGLRYLEIQVTLLLPAGSAETAQAAYGPDGLDGEVFMAAEESFFEPGFYEPADPLVGDSWRQPVLMLERYAGSITIDDGEGAGDTSVQLRVLLEPGRELLQPVAD